MQSEGSDMLERLNRRARQNDKLRADLLVRRVAGYEYLIDPYGGQTNEPPPKPVPRDAELLTIDEYLGIYLPSGQHCKVFSRNVKVAAEMLGCSESDLEWVVRYHEEAHAVVHLGVPWSQRLRALKEEDYRAARLDELTASWNAIEPDLNEQLAQLLAYHCLKDLAATKDVADKADRMLDVFKKLMLRQPPCYNIRPYLEVSVDRLRVGLQLIKEGLLAPRLDPWGRLMRST